MCRCCDLGCGTKGGRDGDEEVEENKLVRVEVV